MGSLRSDAALPQPLSVVVAARASHDRAKSVGRTDVRGIQGLQLDDVSAALMDTIGPLKNSAGHGRSGSLRPHDDGVGHAERLDALQQLLRERPEAV